MSKYTYVVSFMTGCAVGALAMRLWMMRKNEASSKSEERETILNAVKEELENPSEDIIEGELVEEEPEQREYINLVSKYRPQETPTTSNGGPYVISPMEFGDFEDYEAISLTYTSDGVLLDDSFEPVEDVDKTVGSDYAKHFGAYPDDPDTVYIRNDALCSDFEICKDLRTAADFDKEKPHMRWRDDE